MLHKFFIYSKLKIKPYWQIFQLYKPVYSSMWWLMTNMHYVKVGDFLQNYMVDTNAIYGYKYITILMFLIYVHSESSMFHLHPVLE